MLTVAGVGLLGAGAASAQSDGQSLAEKLSTRFNLSQDEVESFLQENREEKQEEHEAERQARLSEALQAKVEDGTITAEQKSLLEEKFVALHEERRSAREANMDLSRDEREAIKEEKKAEFEQWLQENNIPVDLLEDIKPERDGRKHGHHKRG